MDLLAHKTPEVRRPLEEAGAKLVFQRPYSPDLHPVDFACSKLKRFLRLAKARTVESLNNADAMAAGVVTREYAKAWFRHCGFVVP